LTPPDFDWTRLVDWREAVQNLALALLAGFAGLLGYTMRTLDAKSRPSVLRGVVEAMSSAMIGFIVIMICRAFNLEFYWTGAMCGFMGWMGAPASIRMLEKLVRNKLGVMDDATTDKD